MVVPEVATYYNKLAIRDFGWATMDANMLMLQVPTLVLPEFGDNLYPI